MLTLSVSSSPVYLQLDELRLSQALHHLITNACKYTERHGHIHIRAHREGPKVLIVVSDSGAGIHHSKLETIFGLFVRAGSSTSPETGLGLGLYLARHFVEAHGGTVDIGSTTFKTAAAVIAASTALPPSCKARSAATEASGWLVAARPFVARTGERLPCALDVGRSP